MNFTYRELLLFSGVSQLPNASNMNAVRLAFFIKTSLLEQRNSAILFVETVFPDPDSPVTTMHCVFFVCFKSNKASFAVENMCGAMFRESFARYSLITSRVKIGSG